MSISPIISTAELAQLLTDPNLRIFDCRFNLPEPDWGKQNYLEGHIPGAIYADLNRDLAGPVSAHSGRHPLPDPKEFVTSLARWGVTPQTTAVVYDTSGGGMAARLWWMLKAVGHENVRLLDGSLARWLAENRPIQAGPVSPVSTDFKYQPQFDETQFVSSEQLQAMIADPSWRLIDARAPERFQGLQEPIDSIAGHIPGAVNRFHGNNLNPAGTFKTTEQLRQEFKEVLGNVPSEKVVVYCGSGVTSAHHLVALQLAELTGARIYIGSWSEWIRDPSRPIAVGK